MALVSAQKLLDKKESPEESDFVNALGENSQSYLTMNVEIESLETLLKHKLGFINSAGCSVN